MKKLFLVMLSAFALIACHNNDIEPMSTQEIVTNNYNAVFVKTFGEPAANQDWGFGSRVLPTSFGATTRAAYTNGNQWEDQGYTIPADINQVEIDAVLAVFNEKGKASYTSLIDWDEYFVQQVYKGDASYYNHEQYIDNDVSKGLKPNQNPNVVGSQHMDWICTVTNKHVNIISYWPYQEEIVIGDNYDDHINNFNAGNNTTEMVSEKTGKKFKGITLMKNTNSNVFGFKSSEDNGHVFYNFRMEKINGNYYVGFDFEANGNNPNEKVDRDYIYNDWIVKIVPSTGVTPPARYTVRIICEDLNANGGSDFDFNDVVFDAAYVERENKTYVTVQCAGGTLPLFVDGREVHQLFAEENQALNIDVTTMINTNASNGISGLAPVTFTIDHIVAPWDITIAVMRDNNLIPLKAEVGSPAAKIAVDPDFEWVDERVDIRTVYPNFSDYVQDTNVNWY